MNVTTNRSAYGTWAASTTTNAGSSTWASSTAYSSNDYYPSAYFLSFPESKADRKHNPNKRILAFQVESLWNSLLRGSTKPIMPTLQHSSLPGLWNEEKRRNTACANKRARAQRRRKQRLHALRASWKAARA